MKGRPAHVTKGRLSCHDAQLSLNISTASAADLEDFLLVPFPEADTWWLALQKVWSRRGRGGKKEMEAHEEMKGDVEEMRSRRGIKTRIRRTRLAAY